MKESLKIIASDGFKVSASRFNPQFSNGQVVLINSATGVKQKYYAEFALFLTESGYTVYTYDYRGIGASRPKSLKRCDASMKDWGTLDYHALLQNVFQSHSGYKVVVIGHSIGGQIIALSPLTQKVNSIVMIGAQTVYWKNYPGFKMKVKLYWFWFILLPGLTKLLGYFPASALGLFEDLPKEVALQWSRWAKTPNYLFEENPEQRNHFRALTNQSLMISFTDDELAPPRAVKDLMAYYQNLQWQHWHLSPRVWRVKKIGHFGFFKSRMKTTLWLNTLQWMKNPKASEPLTRIRATPFAEAL